jgi:hypothetical protein
MREFSAAELDLMARAFERAREKTLETLNGDGLLLAGGIVESLVDGISEAFAWGERDVGRLVSAALTKLDASVDAGQNEGLSATGGPDVA